MPTGIGTGVAGEVFKSQSGAGSSIVPIPAFSNKYAMKFDNDPTANDQYLLASTTPQLGGVGGSGPWTISFWFYANALTGSNQRMLDINFNGTGDRLQIYINTNDGIAVSGAWTDNYAGFTLSATTWINVIYRYDGTDTAAFIMNGTNVNPKTGVGTANFTTDGTTRVGKRGVGSGSNFQWFDGYIDELSIWNKALSDAECAALYNGGNPVNLYTLGISSSLQHWWRMGDVIGPPEYPSIPDQVTGGLGNNIITNGAFEEVGAEIIQNGDFSEFGPELINLLTGSPGVGAATEWGSVTINGASKLSGTVDPSYYLTGLNEPSLNLISVSEPTSATAGANSGVIYDSFDWGVYGLSTAILFGDDPSSYSYQGTLPAATEVTMSCFVRMDDLSEPVVGSGISTGDFTMNIGGVTTGLQVHPNVYIGNNVWRVSITGTTGTVNLNNNGVVKAPSLGQSSKSFRVTGYQAEAGSSATAYKAMPTITIGNKYLASFTLSDFTGSSLLGFSSLGGVGGDLRLGADGSISEYFEATGTDIRLFGKDVNTGTFSNVSLKEADPNGNWFFPSAGEPFGDWSIEEGKAVRGDNGGTNSSIDQNISIVNDKQYKFSYTRNYTAGTGKTNVYIKTDGINYITVGEVTSTVPQPIVVTGYFSGLFTGTMAFRLFGIDTWEGSMENISVKQLAGDWKFTQGSAAGGTSTVMFEDGVGLYGSTGCVFTGDAANTWISMQQTGILTIGKTYQVSFMAKRNGGTDFNLKIDNTPAVDIPILSDTFQPYIVNFEASVVNFVLARSTSGGGLANSSVIVDNIEVKEIGGTFLEMENMTSSNIETTIVP